MATNNTTVIFIQGDTISRTITIKERSTGNAIDITGGTVKFRIVKELDDKESEALYVNNNVTITDAQNGVATLSIGNATTKAWTPGDYYWEVEYIDSSSNYNHTYTGICVVKKSIYANG